LLARFADDLLRMSCTFVNLDQLRIHVPGLPAAPPSHQMGVHPTARPGH
jgi:hypothetical protein